MLSVTFSSAYWKLVEHSNVDKCVGAFLFCICRWCITSSCGLVVLLVFAAFVVLLLSNICSFLRLRPCYTACLMEPSTHWFKHREHRSATLRTENSERHSFSAAVVVAMRSMKVVEKLLSYSSKHFAWITITFQQQNHIKTGGEIVYYVYLHHKYSS